MHTICSFETADAVQGVDLSGKIAVVIDILRATTTIVTAFANGAKQIFPVKMVDEVFELAQAYPDALKAGERGGAKVPGFDFGNSPREYQANAVKNKSIIFTTTNGTQALVNAESADKVLVAAFLNLQSVADYLLAAGQDVAIIQAGTEGEFTLEDAVCAGYLVQALVKAKTWQFDERSKKAIALAADYKNTLDALHASHHGQNLIRLGFEPDLEICAQLDSYHILPVYKEKIIRYS